MEAVLLRLLGVAMAFLAMIRRAQRPALTAIDGMDIVAGATARRPSGMSTVTSLALSRFWAEVARGPAPRDQLQEHLERLAELVVTSGGCACALFPSDDEIPSDEASRAKAADDIATAIIEGAPGGAGSAPANLQQSRQTLVALIQSILSSGPDLPDCLDAAAETVTAIIASAAPNAYTNPAGPIGQLQLQLANDTGIATGLIEAIVAAQARIGAAPESTVQSLPDRVVDALELLGDLVQLAERAGNDDALEAEILKVADTVRAGALRQASCDLAALSRNIEASAEFPARCKPDMTGLPYFPALLAARARLAGLDGEALEAARLYQRAAQLWPYEDRIRRWRLKISQARQLQSLGRLPNARLQVLCEAAQVFAAAGGLITERDCPVPWAEANLELGTLLLYLGRRENRPERYLAAALHFKPAIEVFAREKAMDGWARSQVGLADALRGQGSFQGDVIVLRDAAFAYRAALGILTEDGAPELWHEARSGLGETLARIAEETGDIESLQSAIDVLLPYTDAKTAPTFEPGRSQGELALGRAMLFLEKTGIDAGEDINSQPDSTDVVLRDAAMHLSRALERNEPSITTLDRARAENALGSAYLLRCKIGGEAELMELGLAAKCRARELYEQLDDLVMADNLAVEIAEIRASSSIDDPRAGSTNAGTHHAGSSGDRKGETSPSSFKHGSALDAEPGRATG